MGLPNMNLTARTTLGARLVLSSAYFQAGAAELIGAEGGKLQQVIAAVSSGSLSVNALTTVNRQISNMVIALSNLENAILTKIEQGIRLHNNATW